ncbi:hypothetical protein TNCV_2182611 [Trichonephila clavipes]|uniref:Transmembrane protein n=1 Tax=Trichonephila clavipes TaxID=2585209 RepID=A0A8X6VV43_TRICX|nr:hypothetical protein TNCV_2182611 [Trichonephila clavipes]
MERNNRTQQEKTIQLGSRNKTTHLRRRKQLNSSVGTKQLNFALPSSACNRRRHQERNNSTQQEKTTQLGRRNETTQLCVAVNRLHHLQPPAPPTTACTTYKRLYSRIGFFYLLMSLIAIMMSLKKIF